MQNCWIETSSGRRTWRVGNREPDSIDASFSQAWRLLVQRARRIEKTPPLRLLLTQRRPYPAARRYGQARRLPPPKQLLRKPQHRSLEYPFMVDVIKSLDIEYVPSNPAQSFRGLHESLIDYGGNKKPEFLTCTHEESSVAMAHGYFKI